MTKQLERIIEDFGTNQLVRTNTHGKTLSNFITRLNQLIHLFKQDQQYKQRDETNLRQEITNISHDLRTPLTSIKGFSDLLTDPSLSEAEREKFLAIIQKKIAHLTMTVDLFYDLSQIESSDHPIVMEKLYLDQIVVEAMLLFHKDFEEKDLKVDFEEVSLPPIFADQQATNRIVMNIIQNVIRYAKSYVSINLTEEENYIQLSVVNDVHAFDQTKLHRIFERTFTLDSSRAEGQHGLGLHIVQQLIHKQGGEIVATVDGDEFTVNISFKKWD